MLNSNNDKRLQRIHKEINAFKVCKNEMLSKYKWSILMITQMKTKQHNLKWPYIPDHPYRILIIGSSGPEKTNKCVIEFNKQPVRYW